MLARRGCKQYYIHAQTVNSQDKVDHYSILNWGTKPNQSESET